MIGQQFRYIIAEQCWFVASLLHCALWKPFWLYGFLLQLSLSELLADHQTLSFHHSRLLPTKVWRDSTWTYEQIILSFWNRDHFSVQYSSQLGSKEQEKGGGGIVSKPFHTLWCGPSCKTLNQNKQSLASFGIIMWHESAWEATGCDKRPCEMIELLIPSLPSLLQDICVGQGQMGCPSPGPPKLWAAPEQCQVAAGTGALLLRDGILQGLGFAPLLVLTRLSLGWVWCVCVLVI